MEFNVTFNENDKSFDVNFEENDKSFNVGFENGNNTFNVNFENAVFVGSGESKPDATVTYNKNLAGNTGDFVSIYHVTDSNVFEEKTIEVDPSTFTCKVGDVLTVNVSKSFVTNSSASGINPANPSISGSGFEYQLLVSSKYTSGRTTYWRYGWVVVITEKTATITVNN